MSNIHLFDAWHGQLHGTIKSQNVMVSGTFPTPLPLIPLPGRKHLYISNESGVTVWLGGNNVTQYNGMPLTNNSVRDMPLGRATLYTTTASATVSGVHITEVA